VLLAPTALAQAPRSFYGVISANDPDSGEIARMGAGKVGTLRINFVWGAVQFREGAAYDWSHYDAIIGQAAQNGIRVLPTVYSSPTWAAAENYHPPARRLWGEFRAFVHAAVARYASNGAFWSQHPNIPKIPIIDWQLWNEPNLQLFWLPKLSPKSYVGLLRVFTRAVRNGDPSGRVLLAGLFPYPTTRGIVIGIPLKPYLSGIYRQKRAKALFDGVAIHPYVGEPHRALDWVKRTRRIMSWFRDRKTPIWITEIGWTTEGIPSSLTVSPQQQAAHLSRTYTLLAAGRRRYRISGVVWYSWRDVPGPAFALFNHTGLFTEAFEPKPAWHAFTALTGGSPG
jgi:polysaccharide biosynthesis protein PslG